MNDELDRIRALREDAPGPSDQWVLETRDELLQLAEADRTAAPDAPSGVEQPWHRRLRQMLSPRRTAWAAAAAVVAVGALALGVGLRGGEGEDRPFAGPPTPTTAPTTSPEPAQSGAPGARPTPPAGPTAGGVELAAGCEGADGLYAIDYPADWHTPAADASGHCQTFDEQRIDPEQGIGGGPFGAITVRPLPVDLAVAADPGRENRQLSAEDVRVDGHPAVRAVWESTGLAALPEGLRSYRYLVDLGDRTLLAAVYDVDDGDFDQRRQLLDAMVATIELRTDEGTDSRSPAGTP